MRSLPSKNDYTIRLIKALSEFATGQNQPVEEVINEFLPYIYESRLQMNDRYHEIEKKIAKIENTISTMEDRIKHQTQKAFWNNLAIFIGIIGGISVLIAFTISLCNR